MPHTKQNGGESGHSNVRKSLSAVLAGSWPGRWSVGLPETAFLIRTTVVQPGTLALDSLHFAESVTPYADIRSTQYQLKRNGNPLVSKNPIGSSFFSVRVSLCGKSCFRKMFLSHCVIPQQEQIRLATW